MAAFLSYSKKNADCARALKKGLVDRRVDVWMDESSIRPGERWQERIEQAILDCSYFVLLLSEDSQRSNEVEAEWSLAIKEGKPVIPILLDSCSIPFRLQPFQYLEMTIGEESLTAEKLASVLPLRQTVRHKLITDPGLASREDLAHFEMPRFGQEPDLHVAMDARSYSTFGELLDDLFMNYLAQHVPAFSYGSHWILTGSPFSKNLVLPWEWVKEPGKALVEIAPQWASQMSPQDVGINNSGTWTIETNLNRSINTAYVAAFNTDRFVLKLARSAKSIWMFMKLGHLQQVPIDGFDPSKYEFTRVYQDWLNIGLQGQVVVETGREPTSELEYF
jgi:hypothetical protein